MQLPLQRRVTDCARHKCDQILSGSESARHRDVRCFSFGESICSFEVSQLLKELSSQLADDAKARELFQWPLIHSTLPPVPVIWAGGHQAVHRVRKSDQGKGQSVQKNATRTADSKLRLESHSGLRRVLQRQTQQCRKAPLMWLS